MPNEVRELMDWLDTITLDTFHKYGWWYVRNLPLWTFEETVPEYGYLDMRQLDNEVGA